ncbi:MAG: hypothetical protein FWF00_03525 [Endomicrobia bacterium]|nr:hypothetical protein [Endomicrobiia bacterium]MCL2506746.1 hypothetical protein [Endomicrobiia bacterium]
MYKPVIFIIIIALSIFVYIWQKTTAMRYEYQVNDLHTRYDMLNAENDSLRFKINSILNLEKMDRVAKEKKLFKADEKFTVNID